MKAVSKLPGLPAARFALMFAWLTYMTGEPGFSWVWLAFGLLSVLCFHSNCRYSQPTGGRARLLLHLGAGFLAVVGILPNLDPFRPLGAFIYQVKLLSALAGGYIACYQVLLWGVRRFPLKLSALDGAQLILICVWLGSLLTTDSSFPVYLLCGMAAVFALCTNRGGGVLPDGHRYILWGFAAVFSFAVMLANYTGFSPFASLGGFVCCALCFAGGCCTAFQILLAMYCKLPLAGVLRERPRPGLVFLAVFASIAILDLTYLLFVMYPGVLPRDSYQTLGQIMGDQAYNNTMPFWHTVTVEPFVRLGLELFADTNAAVALFLSVQVLFMAACFGYALMTLYQAGIPSPALIGVYCLYAFTPYNIVHSITLLKDYPFSGAALLLVTALYRLVRQVGRSRKQNLLLLILGILGFSLWRTNGWYAFALTLGVMALLLGKQQPRLVLMMAAVLAFCWVLINPVLDLLGVSSTDLVEATAVPMQQICRVIALDRPLEAGDQALLARIFQLDQVKALYDPGSVDPVKFQCLNRDGLEYVSQHLGDYLSLYLRLGCRYPMDYLESWVLQTRGYWNGGYVSALYSTEVYAADYGLYRAEGSGLLAACYQAAFRLLEQQRPLELLSAIGFHVWGVAACFGVNCLKKREELLLSIPALVIAAGLWAGSPLWYGFRYACPIILTFPLILCVTLWQPDRAI